MSNEKEPLLVTNTPTNRREYFPDGRYETVTKCRCGRQLKLTVWENGAGLWFELKEIPGNVVEAK